MPKAKNKKERVTQIAAWLAEHYPPVGGEPYLKWIPSFPEDDKDTRYCAHVDNYTIVLSEKANHTWYTAIDTLLHEWAHLLHGADTEEHGVEWGVQYAKIYSHYHDKGGWKDSKEY